jgi:predicted GIY-YIG superfamily endonuclease
MNLFFVFLIAFACSSRSKKDGTPDHRYSENRVRGYNNDGTLDHRYSENRVRGYNNNGNIDKRYLPNRIGLPPVGNGKKYIKNDYTPNDAINDILLSDKSTKIVYGCTNKKTYSLDYVGVTNDFNRRMKEHSDDDKIYSNPMTHLCEIIDDNIMNSERAYQREKEMIKICKDCGQCSLNLNKGGGGPR